MFRNSATPSRRGLLGVVVGAALALGCSDVLTPRETAPPARATMSISATVAAESATQILFLVFHSSVPLERLPVRDTAAFSRLIGMSLVDLDASTSQSFPLSIDLGPCLEAIGSESDTCPQVYVEGLLLIGRHTLDPNDPSGLSLLSNSILDADIVGPFAVARGATVTAPRALVLHEVASIEVDSTSHTLLLGQSATIGVTLLDLRGQEITGKPVTFTSNDPSIAQVDAAGRITAVAPGLTFIEVEAGGRSASVFVEVVWPSLQIGPTHSAQFLMNRDSSSSPTPSAISFAITSSAGGGRVSLAAPSVSYGSASGWLDVSLGGSTTPATMTLIAGNVANLLPGVYQATVTVRSTDPSIGPDSVLVTLTVQSSVTFDLRPRSTPMLRTPMGKR